MRSKYLQNERLNILSSFLLNLLHLLPLLLFHHMLRLILLPLQWRQSGLKTGGHGCAFESFPRSGGRDPLTQDLRLCPFHLTLTRPVPSSPTSLPKFAPPVSFHVLSSHCFFASSSSIFLSHPSSSRLSSTISPVLISPLLPAPLPLSFSSCSHFLLLPVTPSSLAHYPPLLCLLPFNSRSFFLLFLRLLLLPFSIIPITFLVLLL